MMWEFKFYSRGGQGAVTAAKILVNAAILEGKFAQAIPSYGQELLPMTWPPSTSVSMS